jgi:lipoprotein signal peptidase
MRERSFRALLWGLALTGLVLDQASKYGVFAWLRDVPNNEFIVFQTVQTEGETIKHTGFRLTAQFEKDNAPHVNHGALFGLFRNYQTLANVGFALVSLAAAVAIFYWSRLPTTARDRWLCAALGLILAGTLGNLYDRLRFNGVRDFLHWNYLFDWPVFNLADCCLVCGAFLLLIQAFWAHPAPHGPEESQVQRSAEASGVSCEV